MGKRRNAPVVSSQPYSPNNAYTFTYGELEGKTVEWLLFQKNGYNRLKAMWYHKDQGHKNASKAGRAPIKDRLYLHLEWLFEIGEKLVTKRVCRCGKSKVTCFLTKTSHTGHLELLENLCDDCAVEYQDCDHDGYKVYPYVISTLGEFDQYYRPVCNRFAHVFQIHSLTSVPIFELFKENEQRLYTPLEPQLTLPI